MLLVWKLLQRNQEVLWHFYSRSWSKRRSKTVSIPRLVLHCYSSEQRSLCVKNSYEYVFVETMTLHSSSASISTDLTSGPWLQVWLLTREDYIKDQATELSPNLDNVCMLLSTPSSVGVGMWWRWEALLYPQYAKPLPWPWKEKKRKRSSYNPTVLCRAFSVSPASSETTCAARTD